MYDFASITLPTVIYSQPYLDAIQSELSVNPSTLVAGAKTNLSLSAALAGNSPKSTKFGLSPGTELLAKSIPLREFTSTLSPGTVSTPITLLRRDTECQFMAKNPLMGVSSGSAFLALLAMMDPLGLENSCVPVHYGEMELGLDLGLGGFNLAFASAELTSCGVEPSLPVRLTFLGVRKMRS